MNNKIITLHYRNAKTKIVKVVKVCTTHTIKMLYLSQQSNKAKAGEKYAHGTRLLVRRLL